MTSWAVWGKWGKIVLTVRNCMSDDDRQMKGKISGNRGNCCEPITIVGHQSGLYVQDDTIQMKINTASHNISGELNLIIIINS